jgi:methionyl-tRNA formyltransferase
MQNLIIREKKVTKVCAIKMVEELDAGPIYYSKKLSLEGKAEDIYLRAGEICWQMIDQILVNKPKPTKQKDEVTLFKRRKPSDSEIPKNIKIEKIYDIIRMLDAPDYPKTFIIYGDKKIYFQDAQIDGNEITAKIRIE